jgi:hydroxymethylbilane synthase
MKEFPHLTIKPIWVQTPGDRDKTTSLRALGKTDFFTKDLDQMLLSGEIDGALHSAKDLPDPLPEGIRIALLTQGKDPRDALVLRDGEVLSPKMVIATSSLSREERVQQMCPDLHFVDIRGTIEERLQQLYNGSVDGVVIAEAALIRLQLTHLNRTFVPGDSTPLQGKLALTVRT